MYDPLIVDTFVRVYKAISPEPAESQPQSHALREIAKARHAVTLQVNSPVPGENSGGPDEMMLLYELARALGGTISLADAADTVAKHLRLLIPSTLAVFYVYDDALDELVTRHAIGDGAALVRGIRIPLGQRLSGWVAANRRTIVNSDPLLDFGDTSRTHTSLFKSCISTALVSDDKLVGVLTLYSGEITAYNDNHRRIIEVVARQTASLFSRAIEVERSVRRDPLTGLPHLGQLEQLIRPASPQSSPAAVPYGLMFIDVVDLTRINDLYGRTVGDEALRHVVYHARRCLRVTDLLFRNTSDELIAYLSDTDTDTTNMVAGRIRRHLAANPLQLEDGTTIDVDAKVTCTCAPHDGISVAELLDAAGLQFVSAEPKPEGSSVH